MQRLAAEFIRLWTEGFLHCAYDSTRFNHRANIDDLQDGFSTNGDRCHSPDAGFVA